MITSEQIRAARALLRLGQQELARGAEVSVATLRRLEGGSGEARVAPATAARIRRVLERAGAEFIAAGVRRRRSHERTDEDAQVRDLLAIADRATARAAENPGFSETDLYDESGLPA